MLYEDFQSKEKNLDYHIIMSAHLGYSFRRNMYDSYFFLALVEMIREVF